MIDGLLEAAARGDSGSLVLRGEAGIGKSALLGYAAERATGMQVLRVTGVEDESDLAFSGLHGLLWPVAAISTSCRRRSTRPWRARWVWGRRKGRNAF